MSHPTVGVVRSPVVILPRQRSYYDCFPYSQPHSSGDPLSPPVVPPEVPRTRTDIWYGSSGAPKDTGEKGPRGYGSDRDTVDGDGSALSESGSYGRHGVWNQGDGSTRAKHNLLEKGTVPTPRPVPLTQSTPDTDGVPDCPESGKYRPNPSCLVNRPSKLPSVH